MMKFHKLMAVILVMIGTLFVIVSPVTSIGSGEPAAPTAHSLDALWETEVVPTQGVIDPLTSIGCDPWGKPHIIFQGRPDQYSFSLNISHAWKEGGSWRIEQIDDRLDLTRGSSLAFDFSGRPHVIYGYLLDGSSASYGIRYAYRDRGQWIIEAFPASHPVDPRATIRIDRRGIPVFSYLETPDYSLKYARRAPVGWRIEDTGSAPSLMRPVTRLDASGYPHVAYLDMRESEFPMINFSVWYGYKDGSGWHHEEVYQGPAGWIVDLVLDRSGKPLIAFTRYNRTQGGEELVVSSRAKGGGWVMEPAAQGNMAGNFVIQMTRLGTPAVAYTTDDGGTKGLWYATRRGDGWVTQPIFVEGSDKILGGAISLTFDRVGTPHVAFTLTPQGGGNGQLVHAWTTFIPQKYMQYPYPGAG